MGLSYDPESWEREYWIYEEKRWGDLVALRREELEEDENDTYLKTRLGDAYILADRHEEALLLMEPLHFKDPEDTYVSHVILNALKGLGKSENDFNWKVKPEILRLDENLFNKCIEILKKKRKKNRTMFEITTALTIEGKYLDFNEQELEAWLKRDNRLRFEKDEYKLIERIEILKKK